jgi:hypothetical protein
MISALALSNPPRCTQFAEFELEQARAALLHAEGRPATDISTGRLEIRSPVSGQVLRVFQESATPLRIAFTIDNDKARVRI